MQPMIRLLLVEDETLVRAAICALLEQEAHLTIVGTADTAEAAVNKARLLQPDVLLLDLHLPDRSGVDVIAELRRATPATQILILSAYADEQEVVAALRAGAIGYVLKTQAITELIKAIEQVTQGQTALSPAVADILRHRINGAGKQAGKPPLSNVERRVLGLVAQGLSNKEIAHHLTLSRMTVNSHVCTILTKLKVTNRTQAALYALRQGWVELETRPVQSSPAAPALPPILHLTGSEATTGLRQIAR